MSTKRLRIYRESDGRPQPVALARHAANWSARLRGLLGRKPLRDGEGLLLTPCDGVHTVGMRYPIDVAFLDDRCRVVRCVPGLKPFRFVRQPGARHTLELPAGSVRRGVVREGDQLRWLEVQATPKNKRGR